jgi:hypothetical protein
VRLAIVVEAISPYCGGGERVAWIHALDMAKEHEVAVITFCKSHGKTILDEVNMCVL